MPHLRFEDVQMLSVTQFETYMAVAQVRRIEEHSQDIKSARLGNAEEVNSTLNELDDMVDHVRHGTKPDATRYISEQFGRKYGTPVTPEMGIPGLDFIQNPDQGDA